MKYVPVIPCYNPPEVFSNIILELSQMGVRDVIIIDDMSRLCGDKKCINPPRKDNEMLFGL